MRFQSLALCSLFLGLPACLDFSEFATETTASSSSSTGGGGDGGSNVTSTGGGGSGGVGGDGGTGGIVSEGGGGGAITGVGPCFADMEVHDDFNGGETLTWDTTGGVDFTNDEAQLTFSTGNAATMELSITPKGVLDECYFQMEFKKADIGTVYMQWRGPAPTDALGFVAFNGALYGQFSPDVADFPLPGDPGFRFVRIGEENDVYFIHTADEADGPWTERFSSEAPASWAGEPGFLVLGAYSTAAGGPFTAVFDNLN